MINELFTQYPIEFVVFGATGNLMRTKIAPALIHLLGDNFIHDNITITGFARRPFSDDEFRELIREDLDFNKLNVDVQTIESFMSRLFYHQGDFGDLGRFRALATELIYRDKARKEPSTKIYYLAVPPNNYAELLHQIADSGLSKLTDRQDRPALILVEKPLGRSETEAKELCAQLKADFTCSQVLLVDHYLAKEGVRNITAFRYYNALFRHVWNGQNIEKITINIFEPDKVSDRGDTYDVLGALRDVGQNHLLQMLAVTLMTLPNELSAEKVRAARSEVLNHLPELTEDQIKSQTRRGQYAGYRNENGVHPMSETESWFRINFNLDDPAWQNTEIELSSGKAVTSEDRAEIIISFTCPDESGCPVNQNGQRCNNVLRFAIQPQIGVDYSVWLKEPGMDLHVNKMVLSAHYGGELFDARPVDAYERLLLDAFSSNPEHFTTVEDILHAWKFIDPIIAGWQKNLTALENHNIGELPN